MIDRLLITFALLAAGYIVCMLIQRYMLGKASETATTDPLLSSAAQGVRKVLYFTTPTCAPCLYAQRPALEKLRQEMGDTVEIIQVDATEDPEAASRWKVQTVPTTFILDEAGNATQVNHGVADFQTLRRQLGAA